MSWREVAGMTDDDLKRYEEHRRLVRIVASGSVVEHLRDRWQAMLPIALSAS